MIVALLDRERWGAPRPQTGPTVASSEGLCVGCGTAFYVGDEIVLADYGPPSSRYQSWIHETCPDPWELLALTIERYDDKIVTKIQRQGRGRASGCGHVVDDRPIYLVRRPVPLDAPSHSAWYCELCVTPGGE